MAEWTMPNLERYRDRLLKEAAARYQRKLQDTMPPEPTMPVTKTARLPLRVPGPLGHALAIVSTPLGQRYREDRYQQLVDLAGGPRQSRAFPEIVTDPYLLRGQLWVQGDDWFDAGSAGTWAQATAYLEILGEDKGEALRRQLGPRLIDQARRHDQHVEKLRKALLAHDATWVDFLVWYQDQKEELQRPIIAEALERRHARTIGHPQPYVTMEDYAAELVSYASSETPPWDLEVVLEAGRRLEGRHRWAEPENWYEASKLHVVLGKQDSLRRKVDALWHTSGHTPTWSQIFDPDDPTIYTNDTAP